MKKQRKFAAIVCTVLLAFAACGGGADSDEGVETPPSSSKVITAFITPASIGVIDEDAKTISITYWRKSNITPIITHTGASISPASGEAQDFSSSKNYTVTAEDGTTQHYEVTVTVKEYALRDIGPGGGRIFYINPDAATDGWKYLECAPATTEKGGGVWGGYNTTVTGADGTAIGTGKQNTIEIVKQFGETEPYEYKTDYAAKLCSELECGGYSDWFLPSKDELYEMCWVLHSRKYSYINNPSYGEDRVGGLASGVYWSSSEYDASYARYQAFDDGYQYYVNKNFYYRVRAVRSF